MSATFKDGTRQNLKIHNLEHVIPVYCDLHRLEAYVKDISLN